MNQAASSRYSDTRQHILSTAQTIILGKGFAAVGLNEILKTAGVPKGSFYHYFDSKEHFGSVLLENYFDQYMLTLDSHFQGDGSSAVDRLLNYFDNWKNSQCSDTSTDKCLVVKLSGEVTRIWGADRVGVRLSPLQPFNDVHDSHPEQTFRYAVEQLDKFGLAYLHITEMGIDNPGAAGPAFDIHSLRPLWHGIYMTNYDYSLDKANDIISRGEVDLVSFGKLFIANPDLPLRFEKNAPLNEPDPDSFYGGDERGYIDYPFLEA